MTNTEFGQFTVAANTSYVVLCINGEFHKFL